MRHILSIGDYTSVILLLPKYWSLEMDLALAKRLVASPLFATALLLVVCELEYLDLFFNC